MKTGLKIWLTDRRMLTTSPLVQNDNPVSTSMAADLLKNNIIGQAKNLHLEGFYITHFTRPKPDGTQRLIANLKLLNKFIQQRKFKMLDAHQIRQNIGEGHYMVSIDLHQAYSHILIHPKARKYTRFVCNQGIMEYQTLCFGLSTGPRIFTELVGVLAGWAAENGIQMLCYLDDFLIHHSCKTTLVQHRNAVIQKAAALGWMINIQKSFLVPTKVITYLGMILDTSIMTVKPTQKRIDRLHKAISGLNKKHTSTQEIQTLQGILVSLGDLVPLGKLHRRDFQFATRRTRAQHGNNHNIVISEDMRKSLKWWTKQQNLLQGVPIRLPDPQTTVTTDASLFGWGAVHENNKLRGKWNSQEATLHINQLEMIAVIKALTAFIDALRNKHILIMTDNMTVLAHIRHQGGTTSRALTELTSQLLNLAHNNNIYLSASHISSDLNVLADRLSRKDLAVKSEWKLNSEVFQQLCNDHFQPEIDLFATCWNAQLKKYVSPCPDPKATHINAMTVDWNTYNKIYLYPPIRLLDEMLRKLQVFKGQAIVIAPLNHRATYYTLLKSLCKLPPIRLVHRRLLSQGIDNIIFHEKPQILNLHAWII